MPTVKKAKSNLLADSLSIVGVALIGYGLYLFNPWVSYTIIGFILLIGGISAQRATNAA